MELNLVSSIAMVLLLASLFALSAIRLLEPTYDPKEPPVLPQKIPYIGHILGLLQHGLNYYKKLSAKSNLPIYTLQTLYARTYVVNSPDLVVAVQRNAKNLTFNRFIVAVLPRFLDVGDDVVSTVKKNLYGDEGDWGVSHDIGKAIHAGVAPGLELDSLTQKWVETLNPFMDDLAELGRIEGGTIIDLFAWIKQSFGVSTTEAIYGPENPYKVEPELLQAFWDFEDGFTLMLLGIAQWMIVPKAYKARQRIFDGMNRYYERNWREGASTLIKGRYDACVSNGLSVDAVARFELGDAIGVMINAIPTTFWLLIYVYPDLELLENLREEITSIVVTEIDVKTSFKKRLLNVNKLRESCPLLVSTYQEVLRIQTNNTQSRWVVKDTVINDQYLLKKDSVVQMPGAIIHEDPAVWGPDAKIFNPRRFLKGQTKYHPGAFRSFGGGATLCPGRHLALIEIISFAAMFMMRFEATPVNWGWRLPGVKGNKILNSVPPPSSDIKVKVRIRDGFERDQWVFDYTNNNLS